MTEIELYTFYVIIVVKKEYPGGKLITYKKWDKMPFHVRSKWRWYFEYRAALFQVQYPRDHVDMRWGKEEKKNMKEIEHRNKIRAKKGKITEYKNRIALAEKHWNNLFPISDYEPYIRAKEKLERLKRELKELQSKQVEVA